MLKETASRTTRLAKLRNIDTEVESQYLTFTMLRNYKDKYG